MPIPKKIHYCWFGRNPLPELAVTCIESWKKYLPDYEIIEWNEDNFDITKNKYVTEAYESKKYAFVSDYVRLYALYHFGGIYMDTDVEVLKSLDIFLENQAFSGFEDKVHIPTGIMACEVKFSLFKEFLEYYSDMPFLKSDGTHNLTTNVTTITSICKKYGLKKNNTLQTIQGFTLYPNAYFCPKSYETGVIEITNNTYTIHHFSGSWLTTEEKTKQAKKKKIYQKYGKYLGKLINKLRALYARIRVYLKI